MPEEPQSPDVQLLTEAILLIQSGVRNLRFMLQQANADEKIAITNSIQNRCKLLLGLRDLRRRLRPGWKTEYTKGLREAMDATASGYQKFQPGKEGRK